MSMLINEVDGRCPYPTQRSIRTNLEGVLKTSLTFNWMFGGMDDIWLHDDDS